MLKILEPQPLANAVAYKKIVYRCNCQINYTLFYKDKLWQNKQAEIAKNKNKLTKLSGLEVQTKKITLRIIQIPFENMLRKK